MSNHAARTPLYAPTALALTLKQSVAAPTRPAPEGETSNQSSAAALPLPHVASTVPKTIRQATGTARPVLYLLPVLRPTPLKQRQSPLLPPTASLNLPSTSCLHPTRTPWTLSQTKRDPPLPVLHPPSPCLESPLEFATPTAPLCPVLMGPSGSTARIGRPQPDGEPSPSPAPSDQSASRW